MEYELIITILIIVGAMVLFATEAFRIDLVALTVMVLWVILGVLTPEQSFKGFSNPAMLTVAAMFVLSDALIKAGVLQVLAPYVTKLFSYSYRTAIAIMGGIVALFSGFLNNTPVVATLIPIVSQAAKKENIAPSQVLIPLSYAAIFGGTCTLIGTSTNLLVSGIASSNDIDTIQLFTITPIGLIFLLVGMTYLLFFSKKLLPRDEQKPMEEDKNIKTFLTEVEIQKLTGDRKGFTLEKLFMDKDLVLDVVQIKRGSDTISDPKPGTELKEDDVLLLKGPMEKVKKLVVDDHLSIVRSIKDKNFPEEQTKIVEIVVMPGGRLIDKKLNEVNFVQQYHVNVLAIRQKGKRKFQNLEDIELKAGDILLLQTNQKGYKLLKDIENSSNSPFVSIRESHLKKPKKRKILTASAVLLGVILLPTFNILPIVISAWAGVALLAMLKLTNMTDAYRAIDWRVVFLLVGSLSFGEAMKQSGLSELMGNEIAHLVQSLLGPTFVVSVVYLTTNILTETMSNNAAAALMAPIAIAIANSLDVNATPLLIAVMVAGSASFMTPIGYQTNTMVYSAGDYKFTDFLKFGTPLNVLIWIVSSILIPLIYPL